MSENQAAEAESGANWETFGEGRPAGCGGVDRKGENNAGELSVVAQFAGERVQSEEQSIPANAVG